MFKPEFISLLRESAGEKYAEITLEALTKEPSTSVRLNPSKLKECPFDGAERIPWSPYGYILKERPVFTLDPLFHAGAYYVQESSAMMVGELFRQVTKDIEGHLNVLDLCAAPGGKTTDIAASLRERLGDNFSLIANEPVKNRYSILKGNVETWGDKRVGVVSKDPSAFGSEPMFDVIVTDVPCSGEGMFRKDPRALQEWTPDLPSFCAARSRRILADIWPTLREGGILIYSTCTFNHLENDDTVEWTARELGADVIGPEELPHSIRTKNGFLMLPGLVPGEGQYAAALRKHGEGAVLRRFPVNAVIDSAEDGPMVNVDRATALKYLHGDAIKLPDDAPRGPVTISFQGLSLGPAKNLGTRCNNLYPKGKRIKMDV
ncbi:MAG: hypothetical protein II791_07670 [Bacteroidales bacterium]|nr:hypothetical protein [Bacteroidales bacterium]